MARALGVLLFLAGIGVGQDLEFGKDLRKLRPLEIEVPVPQGWKVDQDHTGLVARDEKDNGFIVSREPMLRDPKELPDVWAAQLAAGGRAVKVEPRRAGRYAAWRAAWTSEAAGGRSIEIWRVHVPDNEMLYNFSFTAAAAFPLESLVDGVLKGWKCDAARPELRFQRTGETVTNRITFKLPEGYAKEPARWGGLGGGLSGAFIRVLPGYPEPHVAGRIECMQINPRGGIPTADGYVAGTDTEGILGVFWTNDSKECEVTKKARGKATRYAGMKGDSLEGELKTKSGIPKVWYGFCGKHKQDVVLITIVVDERELRLNKNYFKDVLSQLDVQD